MLQVLRRSQVGAFSVIRRFIALVFQERHDFIGIVDVHLTAKGLNIQILPIKLIFFTNIATHTGSNYYMASG